MTDDSYKKEMDKWCHLVGSFILSFGDIELITYRLWKECFPDNRAPNRFKERTNKIIDYLKEQEEVENEIIKNLQRALKIANRRNTIAHNPVQVQVFQHSRTGQLMAEQAICSITNKDYIDDLELIELKGEVEDILSSLYMKIGFSNEYEQSS
jgi:hypothetical protein